ncbi:MFS general substrate transporter, partial [Lophiostoma macrostomum CBS 122681]
LALGIFLSSLDLAIVATALVPIANSLGSFDQSTWIVNSYTLTYTGFLIILSKISDIFGRKSTLTASLLFFVVFSAACGASQTTIQLVIFRAFQGIAGAGMYSVTYVILFEICPPENYALYSVMVTSTVTLAVLCGVVLGGAISRAGSWRWIFWINIPIGCVATAILVLALPNNFPSHHLPKEAGRRQSWARLPSAKTLKRIDFLGTALLLGATILFVAALEEAAAGRAWDSGLIISFLVVSSILWSLFLGLERRITLAADVCESVLPWRLIKSRVAMGVVMSMLFAGGQYAVCLIVIPQRYQTLHAMSPLQAALRVFPFGLTSPFAGTLAAGICKKRQIPPIYFCLAGTGLQMVGMSLMATAPTSTHVFGGFYGYQVVAGFGVGLNLILLTLTIPLAVEERDRSTGLGTLLQARHLGSAICLAVTATILNHSVRSHLRDILLPADIDSILKSAERIDLLPLAVQDSVRHEFGEGYNLGFMALVGFAAAQLPANLLMWRREQVLVN